jgi:hypothetical protein
MCDDISGLNHCVKIKKRKETEPNILGDITNVKGKSIGKIKNKVMLQETL